MTEENKTEQSSQTTEQESGQTNNNLSIEDLQKEIEKERNYRIKAIEESKHNAEKYKKLRDEIAKKEEEELAKSKNFEELLEREKQKNEEIFSKYNDLQKNTLRKSLMLEVAKYATDAHDINDVINNLNKDNIKMDADNFMFEGLEEEINRLKKEKWFLFKQKEMNKMINNSPSQNNTSSKISYEEWLKLPRKEMDRRIKDVV